MDIEFEFNGISFTWDSAKAHTNLIKHGIAFEQAVEVFFDPFVKLTDASRSDEKREAVIGMDRHWNLLFVVHMELEGESVRIISARSATATERKTYEI